MALKPTVQAPEQVGMSLNCSLQHCVGALFDFSSFCHSLPCRCPPSTPRSVPHAMGIHFTCSVVALVVGQCQIRLESLDQCKFISWHQLKISGGHHPT